VAKVCLLTFKRIILSEPYFLVVLIKKIQGFIISKVALGEIIEKVFYPFPMFLLIIQNLDR